jgi:hypothetical protein
VVAGRSPQKTAAVVADLPGARGLTADFGRLDDVRTLAGELRRLPVSTSWSTTREPRSPVAS